MTEQEWLACNDPAVLVAFLKGTASDRKSRLVVCHLTRLHHSADTPEGQESILLGEALADSEVTPDDVAEFSRKTLPDYDNMEWTALYSPVSDALDSVAKRKAGSRLRPQLVTLLRDVFGNPFRPITFSPDWRTDTVTLLARQMYDGRDFSAMPILADALEDAGCDSADILDHCRGDDTHVRGCWVCDLVLEKS